MVTKRKKTRAVEREGINHVRAVVERNNCIFQEIDLENDLGNDAYIEFVLDENATGCCIAIQVKSGTSYRSADHSTYAFSANADHIEYWANHGLPLAIVFYDPEKKDAFWADLTPQVQVDPRRVRTASRTIRVLSSYLFDDAGFPEFRELYLAYRDRYAGDAAFGSALADFAALDDPETCSDGLSSLLSFHRQRPASWYYLINSFVHFTGHVLQRRLVHALSHLPTHGDIAWHSGNIIEEGVRQSALRHLERRFGRPELISLLTCVDEHGFERGTIGQCAHAIIHRMRDRNRLLYSIAFDGELPDASRVDAFFLWAAYEQSESRSSVHRAVQRYVRRFPESAGGPALLELSRTIKEHGGFGMY